MTHIHNKQKQALLSFEDAAALFSYDPGNGELRRISGKCAGAIAGGATTRGYRHAFVKGKYFAVHRLCWLLHHGEWPAGDIDHINGNKLDNRIENLRSVTCAENNANRPNSPAPKHYGFDSHKGLWRVHVKRNGRSKHIGYFRTESEAAAVAAGILAAGSRRGRCTTYPNA